MPYCQWCQLNSDAPDVCTWCKRPIQVSASPAQRAKADIHYMQVEDDTAEHQFPFFAIIGGVAILALVVYAAVAFQGKPEPQPPKTLNWTLPNQPQNVAATVPQTLPSQNTPAVFNLPNPSRDAPGDSGVPSGDNRVFPEPTTKPADWRTPTYVSDDSGNVGSRFVKNNQSVYFEAVKFAWIYDNKKVAHLVGDVFIVNDAYEPIKSVSLSLSVGGYKYSLGRYSGSVSNPSFLADLEIPTKYVASCHVLAKNFQMSDDHPGTTKRIELDGMLAGKPYHIQEAING